MEFQLIELFQQIKIPYNSIILIHIKLKGITENLKLSTIDKESGYLELTFSIINTLKKMFKAKGILVPAFSYSFTKKGIFNLLETPSEVGRFCEEVRLKNINKRTFDPVFSVIDYDSILPKDKFTDIQLSAFGENCVWEYLSNEGCFIININLEEIVSTHLHYLEFVSKVPYRYNKIFTGLVKNEENNWRQINYNYFVRDKSLDTNWRRRKIEKDMINNNLGFQNFIYKGINIKVFSTEILNSFVGKIMQKNSLYLIQD